MDNETPPASPVRKPRARHGSLNGPKGKPPALPDNPALPTFEPVPRKFRHDGWTPDRQKAFIGALADTGCVSRAARYVNMSMEGAYYLRRQKGSESFRRAWEAALDLGVQRLKDELYERALEGQLKPVFQGGQLKGFQRVKSDRLLMFALRMNAKDEYGRRMAATYFDPDAERLHAGTGRSDGGERAKLISPTPLAGDGLGTGGLPSSSSAAVGQQRLTSAARITDTITGPAIPRSQRDDRNAAIIADFAPEDMSLEAIEAMQAQLATLAARKRAEEDGPPEHLTDVAFLENKDGTFKPVGPLEDVHPVVLEEDREAWRPEEDGWDTL
jgi:hypothetical protein